MFLIVYFPDGEGTHMHKFHNLRCDICFWCKQIPNLWKQEWGSSDIPANKDLPERKEDIVNDLIERDEEINKALGLPPLDAKNPYRFW